MKTTLLVCLSALWFFQATAAPPLGTWEARRDGRKAITLEVVSRDGIVGGRVTLYILHDSGDGSRDGTAIGPAPMTATTWDGKMLRFQAGPATYEVWPASGGRPALRVITAGHSETVQLTRVQP